MFGTKAEKEDLWSRLSAGLKKTHDRLALRLREVVGGRTRIDAELYEGLEEALIEADLGPSTTARLLERLSERVRELRVEKADQVRELLCTELESLLGRHDSPLTMAGEDRPLVSLVVGVNGVGKTTTIGKLASLHRRAGRAVVVCAADTFRAAAGEQLGIWAERAGARLVRHQDGSDPAAVVYDALETTLARGEDVLLVDTAGRLHTKDNLMQELEKIRRVVGKRIRAAPQEVLLILDATTGQNALSQAREFAGRVGVTGLVVTKLDGTARGGIVVSIVSELGIPVHYLGTGEGIDDLVRFDPKAFAEALFA